MENWAFIKYMYLLLCYQNTRYYFHYQAYIYIISVLKLDASCNWEPVQGDKERCDMGPFPILFCKKRKLINIIFVFYLFVLFVCIIQLTKSKKVSNTSLIYAFSILSVSFLVINIKKNPVCTTLTNWDFL